MKRASVLAILIAMGVCSAHADEPMTLEAVAAAAKEGVGFVNNDYIKQRLSVNAELLLIDVRTRLEYDQAHIPGSTWIPRGKAEFEIAKTVRDADREIILYCRTGSRAALVKKALDAQGYRNVSVHAGFEEWAKAGLSVVNELGTFKMELEDTVR